VRLAPDAAVPPWAWSGAIAGALRTPSELSVVCDESAVPPDTRAERGWVALMLEGPFPFAMTGVLSSVLGPLADAGVSIVALSTFDTDHVLVKAEQLDRAVAALERAGHSIQR
jgi:uncharacterized protein